jgi:hypothetical protein
LFDPRREHSSAPTAYFHRRRALRLFAGPFFAESLWNTFVYAIGAAVVAITLGMIQALIVELPPVPVSPSERGRDFSGSPPCPDQPSISILPDLKNSKKPFSRCRNVC